jgi:hypothetical protein
VSHRKLWVAGALALGSCGGLAADGREPGAESRGSGCTQEECPGGLADADGALEGERWPEPERDADEPRRTQGSAPSAEAVPSMPGVGDACGPGPAQGERVTIGEIVLDASGNCGAGHLCLMWAGADTACLVSDDPGCGVLDRDDEFVPVPPVLAPTLPELDRVCTCRCGGGEGPSGAGEYCSCPQGMSCRELIRSSGVNGAAAEFVGSYCLY